MHVVCTAGHVDHGKSALVRALTGMEPDRFAEERERGLTIDLGFAWTEVGSGERSETVAFVDLPGHERFIANMLAGAGAVEMTLFVVAADEGWMPQSREHLDILDLLGVGRGIVALTKTDTVDADTVELATELVRDELVGSALAAAPIVPVSARTGAGLDTLTGRLLEMLASAPAAADHGRPRLWVDRSFTVRGAGTVATGTLAGGRVRVGDELAVLPGGAVGRVRSLQTLKTSVEQALPGSRVAINLSGLERTAVRRGDGLGRADQWRPTGAVDAWIRVLPGHEAGRKGAWHFHAGSGDWSATVYPVGGRPVSGDGYVRLELDRPAALTAGDRFVLREAGRQATVGGGLVLDPDPPPRPHGSAARKARSGELDTRRAILATGDRGALLERHVAERGAADAADAAAAAGLSRARADTEARERGLVELAGAWAHPETVDAWGQAVVAALDAYHGAHPLERVAPKDVAARAAADAGCPAELAGALLDTLAAAGRLVAEGPGLRAPGHSVELDPGQAAARDALLDILGQEPFAPPRLSEAASRAGAPTALVRELEAAGSIVRVDSDIGLLASAVEEAAERLRAAYESEGPLTAARAKEVLGTSRKYALPLLEHLDRSGRTRRTGDVRVVL